MIDPRINQLPSSLGATGNNLACVSVEGAHDLHGNLHEWVANAKSVERVVCIKQRRMEILIITIREVFDEAIKKKLLESPRQANRIVYMRRDRCRL